MKITNLLYTKRQAPRRRSKPPSVRKEEYDNIWPKPIINQFGDTEWQLENGIIHREDGPAVVTLDGEKEWRIHGELHREAGPADIWSNGNTGWYINGKRHREDGPAIEGPDGDYWCLNGNFFTYEEWKEEIGKLRNK